MRLLGAPLALLALLALVGGCASWQGARLYQSGSRALEQGDARRAVAELERAAALVPHASEVQNHLGLAYRAEGRTDAARAAFERALVLDCGNVAARANLRAVHATFEGESP